jgi:hypothetical protein
MLITTWLIWFTDSHEGLIVQMDIAGRSDFAKGMHTGDEIRPRIPQRGLILRMGCEGTPNFVHELHADG